MRRMTDRVRDENTWKEIDVLRDLPLMLAIIRMTQDTESVHHGLPVDVVTRCKTCTCEAKPYTYSATTLSPCIVDPSSNSQGGYTKVMESFLSHTCVPLSVRSPPFHAYLGNPLPGIKVSNREQAIKKMEHSHVHLLWFRVRSHDVCMVS